MELVLLHSTVNIVRRMQQATTMLLVAAAFNIMLKAAFNIFVESSTNRMQHVAVLPQWNTALRLCRCWVMQHNTEKFQQSYTSNGAIFVKLKHSNRKHITTDASLAYFLRRYSTEATCGMQHCCMPHVRFHWFNRRQHVACGCVACNTFQHVDV